MTLGETTGLRSLYVGSGSIDRGCVVSQLRFGAGMGVRIGSVGRYSLGIICVLALLRSSMVSCDIWDGVDEPTNDTVEGLVLVLGDITGLSGIFVCMSG